MICSRWAAVFLLLALGDVAGARVFSFQANSKAAYVRGSLGTNTVHQDAFAHSSGAATLGDEETESTFGGEIGAMFSVSNFNFRIGVEALRPRTVEVVGSDGAGTDYYTLTSEIFAWGPTFTVEYVYSALNSVRFFTYLGVAYDFVSLDNNYAMTAAGAVFFNPVGSHTEKGGATTTSYFAGVGLETMFADNVTLAVDFGYRLMPVTGYKHKHSGPSITGGTVTKDAPLLNADGSDRATDLSGFTGAVGFRFYIDL